MKIVEQKTSDGILKVAGEAEKQVRAAMSDEIRQLPFLVDEFEEPFHPNPMVLHLYKSRLYAHVQEGCKWSVCVQLKVNVKDV